MSIPSMEETRVENLITPPTTGKPGVVDVDYGWQGNNRVELLENGEAYFPRVFEAMRQAKTEILLETFIVFEDKVGNEMQRVLIDAAQRGVRVTASLDGFGCGELSTGFLAALSEAGVHLQIFDPAPKRLGIRTNWFRRLHRKIVVVDGTIAFLGGINFSADHLGDFGPEAKQDYSVEVQGPAVADIHHFALLQCRSPGPAPNTGGSDAGNGVRNWPSTIMTVRSGWCTATMATTVPISKRFTGWCCAVQSAAW